MLDDALIEQLDRGYVCPPDAGPDWRAACECGIDMSLIEDAMAMSPADRSRDHQRALNLILELERSQADHDSRS